MHPIRRFFFASAGAVYWLLARGASAQTQLLINQALKALGGVERASMRSKPFRYARINSAKTNNSGSGGAVDPIGGRLVLTTRRST
jgi:hypothetical protein